MKSTLVVILLQINHFVKEHCNLQFFLKKGYYDVENANFTQLTLEGRESGILKKIRAKINKV